MVYPTNPIYKLVKDGISGKISSVLTQSGTKTLCIPLDENNIDYQQYLEDIKTHGMSIVSCDDCGDGIPNSKSMWQYVENAEELLATKYGDDPNYQKLLYNLKCDRYAKAKQGLFPYKKKSDAYKVIDKTPQDIQNAMRHIPMRT